jgi:hypothetical protein
VVAKEVPVSKPNEEEEEEEEAPKVRAANTAHTRRKAPPAAAARRSSLSLSRATTALSRPLPRRHSLPRQQKAAAKKPVAAKSAAAVAKAASGASRDDILTDPLAEKLRQQRLQEASDLEHAKAAFGEASKNVDDLLPRTEAVRRARARGAAQR